jgi:hypothetical protein
MHAQRYRWQIQGQEAMQDVAHWVVVIGHKRIWHRDAVVPALVQIRQNTSRRRVQEVCVNIILYGLTIVSTFTSIQSAQTYIPRQQPHNRMFNHRPRIRQMI